jgi:prepilin-type N-terminal cleavage/methylation domain-containing protein
MRNDLRTSAGFSLIELMIAVAVFGLITAQLLVVFSNQKRVYTSNERALDVQEQARLTLELISFDTRMGGFMVPRWSAVSSVDGGDDGADRFCVSDASYFDFSGAPSPLDTKTLPFEGAQVVNLAADHVTVNNLDIDGSIPAGVDFLAPSAAGAGNGGGIIISSPTETFCARITRIAGNDIYFEDHDTDDLVEFGDATAYITAGVSPNLRAVPAQVYEVDQNALELNRNGLLLASQIEDMQVEYWLDAAGTPNGVQDDDDEFPVNSLNNPDPPGGAIPADMSLVRRVRLSVLARTTQEDGQSAAGRLLGGRPAMANRIAAVAPDRFRRRSFSASILPRNLVAVGDN